MRVRGRGGRDFVALVLPSLPLPLSLSPPAAELVCLPYVVFNDGQARARSWVANGRGYVDALGRRTREVCLCVCE